MTEFGSMNGSDALIERLIISAKKLSRSGERLGTLERLKEACDAISSGSASDLIRKASKYDAGLKACYSRFWSHLPVQIKAARVDEYVRARAILELKSGVKSIWTGPRHATIRNDKDGLAKYVKLRETEQSLEKPSSKNPKNIDDNIDEISDPVTRQQLRLELERGRLALLENNLIKEGLRNIPGVDIDQVLERNVSSKNTNIDGQVTLAHRADINRDVFSQLLERLSNSVWLSRFDLHKKGMRIKQKTTGETLIDKPEFEAIRFIAGDCD